MDNTAETTEQNIANIVNNIDSSSSTIQTDTSSHGLPEVTCQNSKSVTNHRLTTVLVVTYAINSAHKELNEEEKIVRD